MTVFIDNAEFAQRLQRERDELLAENLKLRKEMSVLQEFIDTRFGSGTADTVLDGPDYPQETSSER